MSFTSNLGKIINDKYRLINILGKGGWGVTYLAEDIPNKQQVALKVLALQRDLPLRPSATRASSLKGLQNWKQIDLLEREARVLQNIEHSAIPSYLNYFIIDTADNRFFYLAQELAPGKSLAEWVKDGWRTTETEVKQIAQQLLEILTYLHSLEPPTIHRDLKPDNIIRGENGKIFLVDFGAVKNTYYTTITGNNTVVGTYGYIAPEQFQGKATTASDLYSLGATILFLLTHISPTELSTDGLRIEFRDRVNLSKDFADWLEIMLEPEIEKRFKDAKQALAVLKGKQQTISSINLFSRNIFIVAPIGIPTFLFALIVFMNSSINPYKWKILSSVGIVPENICEPKIMTNYLKQGGNPNARRTPFWEDSYSIAECFYNIEDSELFALFVDKGGIITHKQSIKKRIKTPEEALLIFKNRGSLNNIQKRKLTLELLNRSPEIALALINNGADINTRDRDGKTLLHITSDREIALLTLEKGIDVNARDKYGNTPLHHTKSLEIAKLLIVKGANVNARNTQGRTPLLNARTKEIALLLIKNGANVSDRDDTGRTLLHETSEKEIALLAIEEGVDINVTDKKGNTPLHNKYLRTSILPLLIEKGANVNARNNEGKTPLHLVRYADSAQMLVDAGANLTLKDREGNTPLHSTSKPEIAEILVENGANINAKNNRGHTKLHLVSSKTIHYNNERFAKILIDAGAKVNLQDNESKTPLHLAAIHRLSPYFIEELLKAGANLNIKDDLGKTPLDYAIDNNNKRIIDLINYYNSNN